MGYIFRSIVWNLEAMPWRAENVFISYSKLNQSKREAMGSMSARYRNHSPFSSRLCYALFINFASLFLTSPSCASSNFDKLVRLLNGNFWYNIKRVRWSRIHSLMVIATIVKLPNFWKCTFLHCPAPQWFCSFAQVVVTCGLDVESTLKPP